MYLGEGGQEALKDLASVSLTTSLSTNALSFVSKTVLYFESGSSDSSSRKSLLFMGETSGQGDSFLFWEICNIELFSGELSLKYVLRMSSKMSWGEDVDDCLVEVADPVDSSAVGNLTVTFSILIALFSML